MQIVPPSRPQQSEETTRKILANPSLVGVQHSPIVDAVALLGVRGYYRTSMGEGKNSRNEYDDALFLVAPGMHIPFNANVDPAPEFKEGVADLVVGVWKFLVSIHGKSRPAHKQYRCLEQNGPVTVLRDGQGLDTGMFAIQIHRGCYAGTGSLGCQTIFPDQYDQFINTVIQQMKQYSQGYVMYLLADYNGGSIV